jgi:hypothetical protein
VKLANIRNKIQQSSTSNLVLLLWHVDLLLGNDREISNYTTAVTRQRSVNNRRRVFYVRPVPRWYKQDKLVGELVPVWRQVLISPP